MVPQGSFEEFRDLWLKSLAGSLAPAEAERWRRMKEEFARMQEAAERTPSWGDSLEWDPDAEPVAGGGGPNEDYP
jgi:hypothetical protein